MLNNTPLNIAILGAGIAGLCAAIALHKKGFKVRLYERGSKVSFSKNNGVGLVLWPNASSVLAKLDLLDEIKTAGYTLNNMQRYTSLGEYINEINFTSNNSDNHATQFKNYAIKRQHLHLSLIKKITNLEIEINYDYRVNKINAVSNQTSRVYFNNSKQITADIIIGADGRMNSQSRQYVAGNNQAIYQGYVNWVGLIESPQNINFAKTINDYWGCGERFAFVPLSTHSAYWAGCKTVTERLGEPEAGNKATLLHIFKDWPDIIQAIIKQTRQQQIKRIEVFDHDPLTSWHRDNVCLIGDAAHAALPTSGQGACQAIEDGYYLAEALATLEQYNLANFQSVFKQFYDLRFKITQEITNNARILTRSIFNTDAEFCRERDRTAIDNSKNRE